MTSNYRLGGFIIPDEEVIAWGARLSEKPVEKVTWKDAAMHILRHLSRLGVSISVVPYPKDVSVLMVVTRCQPYIGWRKGDDPAKLKQYEMHRVEELVQQALCGEGVKNTRFVTSHGTL